MQHFASPYRSVLYIPGSKARALEKAQTLPVDAIIFDLEDAVTPDEKETARGTLKTALNQMDYGPRKRIVRVNGLDTGWGDSDLAMLTGAEFDAVLIPKLETAGPVERVRDVLGPKTEIWAMMETPLGVMQAGFLAALPGLAGFVMGTNDLAKDLGATNRAALQTSLQLCLLAARAHGLVCLDGVYNAFKDEAGLRAECAEGAAMGFDGKTLIHPAQVAIANEVFGPTQDDIDRARRQIAAFKDAQAAGQGIAVLDGSIVENLHVETAKRILAQADAIAQQEG